MLNHGGEIIKNIVQNKYVVAGIYGAGGDEAGDNPLLKEIVEGEGGKMFTPARADIHPCVVR
ncbi:hypothetical protein TRIP_D420250 [uncultured Paludibacter sp.]|uniref:Uncharacterized protein n=1 Tax=uncultured Paludibacter sp. TaxID=497635 RepID=A0A653AHJ4_9BACT|nr:hypothetical protein TRIP_D420250 [uncultured Paludibacter sp.]